MLPDIFHLPTYKLEPDPVRQKQSRRCSEVASLTGFLNCGCDPHDANKRNKACRLLWSPLPKFRLGRGTASCAALRWREPAVLPICFQNPGSSGSPSAAAALAAGIATAAAANDGRLLTRAGRGLQQPTHA